MHKKGNTSNDRPPLSLEPVGIQNEYKWQNGRTSSPSEAEGVSTPRSSDGRAMLLDKGNCEA